VKKFENQLRLGLEPIIGEPGGELGVMFSVAKRILLNRSEMLAGIEGEESRGLGEGIFTASEDGCRWMGEG